MSELRLNTDGHIIKLGADNDVSLTHVADTGLLLNSTMKLQFNDASQFVQGSSATVLSIGATDEIDLTATAIDINGTADVSGAFTTGSTIVSTGKITSDAGIDIDNFNIDGTTIALSSGDLTVDVAGDIILDAAGEQIRFHDAGTLKGFISMASDNITLKSETSNADIIFQGNDGGSAITALTLNMSEAGDATFNSNIIFGTASKGIYLGVTSATAANLLDDYEEGTFTAGITFGGSATGITLNRQYGFYTKIGRSVHVHGYVSMESKGSGTGAAVITGLPFASSGSTGSDSVGSLLVAQTTFANDTHVTLHVNSSSSTMTISDTASTAASTTMDEGNFVDNTAFKYSLSYMV